MAKRPRLFLIDGTALAYRSHFAFASSSRGGLSTSAGKPTGAIFGFTITLRSLLDREDPDFIAVAFDGSRKELERTKLYPEYKSTREKAPEEMVEQLDDIRRIVEAHDIPMVASQGHEADDVIGTLAVQGRDAGYEVFIVTGDKDFMQLVDDNIKLWNLRSSTTNPEIIEQAEVVEKFGVEPSQIIDMLALMGDASDNVPGVPRVGKKTATKLLVDYKTLDNALEQWESVKPPSISKALHEHKDLALLSRDLVTIKLDVPIEISVADLKKPAPETENLRELFLELEFDRLANSLANAKQDDIEHDYRCIENADQLDDLLALLRTEGRFAIDTETTSLNVYEAKIVGVSFSMKPGTGWYLPFNQNPPILEGGAEALLESLRPILEDAAQKKTAQNAKYDWHVFKTAGVDVQGLEFDTMLASYCLAAGLGSHGLDSLAQRHFGYTKIPTKDLIGSGKKQKTFDELDISKVAEYAAEDADFTWRLREKFIPELEEMKVQHVFYEIEMPLVQVLIDMEREGIRVDTEHLAQLSKSLEKRIAIIQERIFERAGEPFNLNSPAQIGKVLFDVLEVHRTANIKPKKTKTGQWKTDAAVLDKLAPHHEVPQLILEYRQLSKLKSTYVDSLPTMVNPETGRIHSSFNQAVAATGRLSSDNPNLQNIPIRTVEGREVRKAFIAREEGWQLLSADYSQIELRILAHICEDAALIDAFTKGEDIHTRTAATVFGVMPALVDPEQRSHAKAINYGLVYGMGASRLSQETGMSKREAQKFIEAYFRAFPGIKRYLDDTLIFARENGFVQTLYGRRRQIPDIQAKAPMLRSSAENMAVNTPIQGTAADIIKLAMLELHSQLHAQGLRSKLLLQVHDELVLDVPEDELDQCKALLRSVMEGAADFKVPLDVTMSHGWTWLDAH